MKMEMIQSTIAKLLGQFARQEFPAEVGWQIIRRRAEDHPLPSDAWSPGNRWLMLAGGTSDARGFAQWHGVGRRVKPGSKALYICAPIIRKRQPNETDEADSETNLRIIGFRWIPVFRLEDTAGASIASWDYTPSVLPPLFHVAERLGASVTWQPFAGRALGLYRPGSKQIFLAEQSALTFFHELCHHVDAQLQPLQAGRLAEAELVAEFGGAVLCSLQGITGYEAGTYRYLQAYAETKEPEAVLRAVMTVAARVEKIVGIILDATEKLPEFKENKAAVSA